MLNQTCVRIRNGKGKLGVDAIMCKVVSSWATVASVVTVGERGWMGHMTVLRARHDLARTRTFVPSVQQSQQMFSTHVKFSAMMLARIEQVVAVEDFATTMCDYSFVQTMSSVKNKLVFC